MLEWTEANMVDGPRLRLVASDVGLRTIEFHFSEAAVGARNDENGLLMEATRQLRAYFAGERREFRLPMDPQGTVFQRQVWRELESIPYGQTRSYSQVAAAIGAPRAVRAVGAANGANPLPIVVPCHRVIGADGRLTGYGGGLALKKRLLEMEGALTASAW